MDTLPEHVPAALVRDFDYQGERALRSGQPHEELIAQLRDGPPAVWSQRDGGYWVLSRSEDIVRAFQSVDLFSSYPVALPTSGSPRKLVPVELDPPEHSRYRNAEAPFFTPHVVNDLEDGIRKICVELLDEIAPRGACDFLADFASILPARFFAELLALPPDDLPTFIGWTNAMNKYPTTDDRHRSGAQAISAFLGQIVASRQTSDDDDIVSRLWRQPLGGQPPTFDDIFDMTFLLFLAGLDTTASALSFAFRHLATHPDEQARVAADPTIIPAAIEELLRLYPVSNLARTCRQDVEIGGVLMKAGDHVLLPITLANRDPRVNADTDTAQLERQPNKHFTFGVGPHRCIGSHVARREMRIAWEEWHSRIPSYRIADGAEAQSHGGGAMGLTSLPLVWEVTT